MSSTATPSRSSPSRRTWPALGRSSPEIVRSSEVLPAPFAPSTAVMLPPRTVSETPSTARTGP